MLVPNHAIQSQVLTAAAATYYTAPTATRVVVQNMTLCNTTAAAVVCTVYIIASGGTAGTANTIISATSVAKDATYKCPEMVGKVLNAGDFIQAKGLNVVIDMSVLEVS